MSLYYLFVAFSFDLVLSTHLSLAASQSLNLSPSIYLLTSQSLYVCISFSSCLSILSNLSPSVSFLSPSFNLLFFFISIRLLMSSFQHFKGAAG